MILANLFFINSILFLIGILIASLISFNSSFLILFFIIILGFFLNIFKFNLSFKYILIFIFVLLFGFLYFHFRIFWEQRNNFFIYNQKIEFIGKISSDVLNFENYKKFTIKLESPFHGKLDIITSKYSNYQYGDRLKINGIIEKSLKPNQNSVSFYPEINFLESKPDFKLFSFLYKIKNYFLNQFKKFFSYDEQALISGIIFGQTSEFSKSFKEKMNNSGTMHIVALSGYNVGILVLIINSILIHFLGRKNILLISLFTIFCFVVMTGAESSVLRAALMFSLMIIAQNIGRIYSFWHALIFAALIMNILNPKILIYDLGFQLSFLSILGIIYFKPYFDILFKNNNESFLNWKENLTTTLGAQIAVLPLIFLNFGKISLFSLIANILILSFIPLLMFFGFIIGIFSFIRPFAYIISLITSLILKYEIFIINFFGSLNNISFNLISVFLFILFYVWLFYNIFKIKYYSIKNE
ncbi:MAG: ComEC family competence protein [Patescibacteria group bacterium]|nr:ComEC family competence protein [Patescibacteria group bacterium]MDW8279744.1 ComEC/Rec2 family competence protein [bacterium]